MSEQAQAVDGRAAALAAFDAARDRFLAAFAQAPDEALPFVPAGEEYALGVLPMHMQDPMRHYLAVFDMARAGNFGHHDRLSQAENLGLSHQLFPPREILHPSRQPQI